MKISERWIREYIQTNLSIFDIGELLTSSGLNVINIFPVSFCLPMVFVGEIFALKKKKIDGKYIKYIKVNIGIHKKINIITQEEKIELGSKVCIATIGARIFPNIEVKPVVFKKIYSSGILCFKSHIGIKNFKKNEILYLPKDAPIGHRIDKYLNLFDNVMEIEIPANRGDCNSIIGIIREISAITKQPIHNIYEFPEIFPKIEDKACIQIKSKELCPKYISQIIKGVDSTKKTPIWLSEKLRHSGIQSVSILVDIGNYVMLLLGQPLHIFDYNKIKEKIFVQFSEDQDQKIFESIDGKIFQIKKNTLLVTDNEKILALAGIIGGKCCKITQHTTSICIESALYDPKNTFGKYKYGLCTESELRFRRGIDPEKTEYALKLATNIIVALSGGKSGPIVRKIEKSYFLKSSLIMINLSQVKQYLGINFSILEIEKILMRLHFQTVFKNNFKLVIKSPIFRSDIHFSEDVIEEIARIYGYHNIPSLPPKGKILSEQIHNSFKSIKYNIQPNKIKKILINRGYQEIITYSFIDMKYYKLFSDEKVFIKIINPISKNMSVLRNSLLPGLYKSLSENIHHQHKSIRFFEFGSCFYKNIEEKYISGIAMGEIQENNWETHRNINFYTIKSDIQAFLSLTKKEKKFNWINDISFLPNYAHPGCSATISLNNQLIGLIGKIHPNIIKKTSGKYQDIYFFEIKYNILFQYPIKFSSKNISKFPKIQRDLSIEIDINISSLEIINFIKKRIHKKIYQDIFVFDVYKKYNSSLKKSIALRIIFQSFDRTLKDNEINKIIENIVSAIYERYNAKIRGIS